MSNKELKQLKRSLWLSLKLANIAAVRRIEREIVDMAEMRTAA